jgi:hypothetical protein
MAIQTLNNAFLYAGNYDFSSDSNSATLTEDVAVLDATNFNSGGWTEQAAGLKSSTLAWSGHWSIDDTNDQGVSNQGFSNLGSSQVFTFGAEETEGYPAYMLQAIESQYMEGGNVGEILPFTLSASGSSSQGTVRGLLTKARGSVAATGALGTGVNVGAIGSTEYLYGAFHVISSGTTITVTLQSDDNSGFTSPTVRSTLGPITTAGATWVRVAGPFTDTYYRFVVTAITGAHVVAGAIGKA